MVNLIKKDFIVHKYMLLIMLLGIVALMFVDSSVMLNGIVFTFAIIMHIFSADETKPIQMLLSSLPYTRREIVSSKYIGAIVYLLLVISVIVITNYLINQQLPDWKAFLIVTGLVMLLVSLIFPFSYKYSSKYLQFVAIGLFILYLFVLKFVVPNLHDQIRMITARILQFSDTQIVAGIGVVICILYLGSWILSVKIYGKKVF